LGKKLQEIRSPGFAFARASKPVAGYLNKAYPKKGRSAVLPFILMLRDWLSSTTLLFFYSLFKSSLALKQSLTALPL